MEKIRELIHLGKQHFDSKDYSRAAYFLRQAVQEHPGYADVHNMLGVISHIEGRFQTALDYFRQALKINPRYTEAMLNLAILYNDLGHYKDAKRIYKSLKKRRAAGIEIEPVLRGKLSNLHAEIGDIYRSIGLYKHSIEEYQKALHLNEGYHDIRTKLGQALREEGKLEASCDQLARVIKANGNYVSARVQLGVTYYSMGKMNEAKKEWNEVLKISSQNEYAKMYLRLCAVQKQTSRKKPTKKKVVKKRGKRGKT